MALVTTKISICNSSLLYVGADEITAFDDGSREAKICNQIYDTTKLSMLQKYPWRFSLEVRQLSKLLTPPADIDKFNFQNAFVIPAESLRIIRTDAPPDDYIISRGHLYSNRSEVFVEMQIDPDESVIPVYYKNALEFEIAARLSLSLTDDTAKFQLFQGKADLELARAKHIDAQEQPVSTINDSAFLLTSVRT